MAKKKSDKTVASGDAKKHLLARVAKHEHDMKWAEREREVEPAKVEAARALIGAWEKARDDAETKRRERIERRATLAREAIHFHSEESAINRVREFELLGPDGK